MVGEGTYNFKSHGKIIERVQSKPLLWFLRAFPHCEVNKFMIPQTPTTMTERLRDNLIRALRPILDNTSRTRTLNFLSAFLIFEPLPSACRIFIRSPLF